MMGVRHVRVRMCHRLMHMPVTVCPLRHRFVPMMVVPIVVAMRVLVPQLLMGMLVCM